MEMPRRPSEQSVPIPPFFTVAPRSSGLCLRLDASRVATAWTQSGADHFRWTQDVRRQRLHTSVKLTDTTKVRNKTQNTKPALRTKSPTWKTVAVVN